MIGDDAQNLESLVAALDSEKAIVDIGRVSGFMQKVSTLSHHPRVLTNGWMDRFEKVPCN